MKIARLSSARHQNIGLLLLRLGVGITFFVHGVAKLNNIGGTTMFFESLGLNGFMAWLVAIIETVGGGMLILGIWTALPAALLAIIMIGALFTDKYGKSFMGGYEFEAVLLAASLAIVFLGSGKYSLIRSHMCNNCKECDCSCHPDDKRCGPDGKCSGCQCN